MPILDTDPKNPLETFHGCLCLTKSMGVAEGRNQAKLTATTLLIASYHCTIELFHMVFFHVSGTNRLILKLCKYLNWLWT